MDKMELKLKLLTSPILPIAVKIVIIGLIAAKILPLRGDRVNDDAF
ncbi:MAG: hypothetical protein QXZ56_02575 [Sulfolobales archaeon]